LSCYFNRPFEIPTFEEVVIGPEILNSYVGQYASSQIPLKITITIQENKLMAQATGQSAFSLEATTANSFKFEPAGIILEFNADKKEMTLKQGGKEFLFTKE
jgi:D-alanyl-D-alanine carboxypeptidase